VVREEVRLGLAFYRAEGEVERMAEAVAATVAVAAING
jgi:selenocysteine lyase/cysteine desulfurase